MSSEKVDHSQERHAGYGWLLFCVIGMMSSLTGFGKFDCFEIFFENEVYSNR